MSVIDAIMTGPSVNLIEHLAYLIANKILEKYPVERVLVRIRKPDAQIKGYFSSLDYPEVEIELCRQGI